MKTQSRIMLSVVSSIAVSIVIAFIAFSILGSIKTELIRNKELDVIINKTHALQVLTTSFNERSGRSDIRQVKEILLSLDSVLKKTPSQAAREEILIKQLQKSCQALGPLIDQMFVSRQGESGVERERLDFLTSHILMKVRFISDDTNRLMSISQSRIIAAQKKAGAMVIILIIILALTNGTIYFFSGRGIVRAQEALLESEKRFRTLVEASSEVLYSMSPDWSEMRRLRSGHFLADTESSRTWLQEYIHPDDQLHVRGVIDEAIRNKSVFELEHRVLRANGTLGWTFSRAVPLLDSNGEIVEWFGAANDITERKRAEEELRESEARLIEAQRLARVGDWVWDVTKDEVSWSREMYEIFGRNPNLPPPRYHEHPTYYTPESWEQLESSVKRSLEKGEPYELELEHTHGDGTHRWHIAKGEAIQDSSGCIIKIRGAAQDITERKHMEEALRKSEGRLRRFFDSGVVGVVYWNLEGSITDANDRFLDMVGYTREELEAGRVEWSEMTPPEYHKQDEYALYELATTGIDTAYEKEFVRKDGSRIPIIIGAATLKDNPKDGIAFVLDITARKRAEIELRKAHEKLYGSLESITDGFLSLDREWRCTYFNKTGAMMVGMKREEIIDKMLWDIFPHAVKMKFYTEYHRAVATNTPVHFEEFYPEPLNRWFECHGYPSPEGLSVYFRDITERRRAEEELKASEERYRHLLKYAPTGIYEVDFVNKRFKSVNEVMCQVLGYTEEELLRMDPSVFLDEHGKERFAERLRKSLAGEKVDETVEYQIITKDGRKFWTVLNVAFTYHEGRATGALVVAYDVTERKKAEEILRNSEAQLAKVNQIMSGILEHTHMMAALLDAQFNFVWVNRAYAASAQREHSFFPGKNHFDLYPLEENKWIFQQVVDTGAPYFAAAKTFEYPDQPERGATYWDWSLVPVKDAGGRVSNLVFTLMEVTERIRAEEALRKAHDQLELRVQERTAELEHKTRELQEFAFVASHDLSEPLRKIQTFGDMLKAKSAGRLGEQERDYVSRMTGAAHRMQELLDALLRYSRIETQANDFVPVKLEDIVQTVTTDLEVSIKKTGAHVEIGPLPVINGDPYQWRQLFQNLIANAVKYRRSEAKTVIKIYNHEGTGRIFVEDNGIGFDEKYLDKIFQPFQRLHGKNEYPGTGIGLAICKKIVERHGGTITAKSTPGKGSTFIITLPMDGTKAVNKSK